MSPNAGVQTPSHIPPELVVDFDFFDFPGMGDDPQKAWKDVLDRSPIFWTPRHDGHWVVTRARDIRALVEDPVLYSSLQSAIPSWMRPSHPEPPTGMDPPEHTLYRQLLNPYFSPRAVRAMDASIRSLVNELIDRFISKGSCEFVADFARQFPIVVFMRLAGIPLSDRDRLLALVGDRFRAVDAERRREAVSRLWNYVEDLEAKKRAEPGDDLYSRLIQSDVGGQPIPKPYLISLLRILLIGGLDSLASTISFTMRHLATHPSDRAYLLKNLGNQQKLERARDELMRRYGVAMMTRRVTRDTVFGGVAFRKNETILLPAVTHDLDPAEFPDPLVVNFERPAKPMATFGLGIHFCVGAHLARYEMLLFLQEWLRRIPDFTAIPAKGSEGRGGLVLTLEELELRWALG